MAPSVLQNGGFFLGLVGTAALTAATAMNRWSVKDRQGDVVTSTYTYKGLWQDCETVSSGLTECRPLYGLLGFSGVFQAVRALMVVGVVLSVIGTIISVFSLKCLTMSSMEDTTKAKMSLTAGIMFIIAGVLGIAGAAIYANQIVSSFRMSIYTNNGGGMMGNGMGEGFGGGMGMGGVPTYTFGPALFVAWIGGGALVIAGVLKSLAFKDMVKDQKPQYPGIVYKPQAHSKADHHSQREPRDQNYV